VMKEEIEIRNGSDRQDAEELGVKPAAGTDDRRAEHEGGQAHAAGFSTAEGGGARGLQSSRVGGATSGRKREIWNR